MNERTFASDPAVSPSAEPVFPYPYPARFSISGYGPAWVNDKASEVTTGAKISAATALQIYSEGTDIGQTHGKQTARYPSLHIDLDCDDTEDPESFRLANLRLLTPPNILTAHEKGHQGLDLHPIGHMAIVSAKMNAWLAKNYENVSGIDCDLVEALRHTAALHDVGEAMHPSLEKEYGLTIVGDIGANVGKTPENRIDEGKVTRTVIGIICDTLKEGLYTEDLAEMIARLANHEINGEDKDFRRIHAILEGIHELNTLDTAGFMANRARDLVLAPNSEKLEVHAKTFLELAKDTLARSAESSKMACVNEYGPKTLVAEMANRRLVLSDFVLEANSAWREADQEHSPSIYV